jgi:hypothetical protein
MPMNSVHDYNIHFDSSEVNTNVDACSSEYTYFPDAFFTVDNLLYFIKYCLC